MVPCENVEAQIFIYDFELGWNGCNNMVFFRVWQKDFFHFIKLVHPLNVWAKLPSSMGKNLSKSLVKMFQFSSVIFGAFIKLHFLLNISNYKFMNNKFQMA